MSQNNYGKVLYLDTLTGFKNKNRRKRSTYVEPYLPEDDELLATEYEHYFGAILEEEIELHIGLYDEVKRISGETGYSFEKIVELALTEYLERYRKSSGK